MKIYTFGFTLTNSTTKRPIIFFSNTLSNFEFIKIFSCVECSHWLLFPVRTIEILYTVNSYVFYLLLYILYKYNKILYLRKTKKTLTTIIGYMNASSSIINLNRTDTFLKLISVWSDVFIVGLDSYSSTSDGSIKNKFKLM